MVEHDVGPAGDRHRIPGHCSRLIVASLRREDLGPHRAPRDRCLQVVTGEALTFGRIAVGFVDLSLRENRSRQQGSGQTRVGASTQRVESFQGRPEVRFGSERVAAHRLDDPGEQLRFHEPMPQTQVGHDLARLAEHPARLVRSAAQQFQHRQMAQRRGFEGGCSRRHPLHPNHVEAPAAGLGYWARPPQRGTRRRTQRRGDLSVVSTLSSRDQRLEQVDFAVANPSETQPRARSDAVRLGESRAVRATGELVDGALEERVVFQQPVRGGVHAELASIARRPWGQRVSGDALEILDEGGGGGDVACGQKCLAPRQQKLGVYGLGVAGERRPSCGLCAGGDQLVAVQCASRGCRVVVSGAQGEIARVLVERAQFTSIGVCGLQMAGDHLISLERHTGAARFNPVGKARVQFCALGFQ
ncbi:hypothetical protein [Mycolicibacterium novocastrense]|uniref:hypothetical protein n=1 Tax=Mycolicibacterium novocastrense TaxID=59813 RepID=UPI001F20D318|nr:hypothetical protein [Mycolicibacterium novocastrense]